MHCRPTVNIEALDHAKRFGVDLGVSPINWWRMPGSNRRPPACKAGALPAELIPQDCGGGAFFGGSGWSRTNDPRLIKTVL
jgi:hypothetical protein